MRMDPTGAGIAINRNRTNDGAMMVRLLDLALGTTSAALRLEREHTP